MGRAACAVAVRCGCGLCAVRCALRAAGCGLRAVGCGPCGVRCGCALWL